MECIFVQSDSITPTSVDVGSLGSFIANKSISHVFVSDAYSVTGLATASAVNTVSSACDLASGPYVASNSPRGNNLDLTPVYGLHENVWESFTSGSVPSKAVAGAHLTMQVSIPGTRMPAIIIPSRISSAITTEVIGPLAGLRFAVKDIFHVKGLKTSGGSRAYYQVYGPQNYTTDTVEKSLMGGAQLVGKTRTIAFALGAPNNGKEIDYPDP
jgi:hypothetical protein